jgi:transcription initiation factor TFIIIB Brf1 subunit/transcription initiation factor TFIIB
MACLEHSLVIDEGQQVCTRCGSILDVVIDEGAEWRQYEDTKGEDQSRTGFATSDLLPNSSYGSVVSYKRIASDNANLKHIQRLSCWSMYSNSERSWMGIFDAIQLSCTHAGLPKAITLDACALYKQMEDAQKVRGETRRACMGASVFVACRNNGASRTHEEIADMFHVNIRTLCKAISRFVQTENTVLDTQIGIAERLCSTLGFNNAQRERVLNMLYMLSDKSEDEFEHTPKTIVAGVVSFVGDARTKPAMKPISEASGVSVLSIHKIVNKLKTVIQSS